MPLNRWLFHLKRLQIKREKYCILNRFRNYLRTNTCGIFRWHCTATFRKTIVDNLSVIGCCYSRKNILDKTVWISIDFKRSDDIIEYKGMTREIIRRIYEALLEFSIRDRCKTNDSAAIWILQKWLRLSSCIFIILWIVFSFLRQIQHSAKYKFLYNYICFSVWKVVFCVLQSNSWNKYFSKHIQKNVTYYIFSFCLKKTKVL